MKITSSKLLGMARRQDAEAEIVGDKIRFKNRVCDIYKLSDIGLDTKHLHVKENERELHFFGKMAQLSSFFHCEIQDEGLDF